MASFKNRKIFRFQVGKLFEGLSYRFIEQFYSFSQDRIKTFCIQYFFKKVTIHKDFSIPSQDTLSDTKCTGDENMPLWKDALTNQGDAL
jgi:hypothetical protein